MCHCLFVPAGGGFMSSLLWTKNRLFCEGYFEIIRVIVSVPPNYHRYHQPTFIFLFIFFLSLSLTLSLALPDFPSLTLFDIQTLHKAATLTSSSSHTKYFLVHQKWNRSVLVVLFPVYLCLNLIQFSNCGNFCSDFCFGFFSEQKILLLRGEDNDCHFRIGLKAVLGNFSKWWI